MSWSVWMLPSSSTVHVCPRPNLMVIPRARYWAFLYSMYTRLSLVLSVLPMMCWVSCTQKIYRPTCLVWHVTPLLLFEQWLLPRITWWPWWIVEYDGIYKNDIVLNPVSHIIHSFIYSDHFYSASSSPLLLRSAPHTARILCLSFTPKRHRQLWVKDLPKVPTWRLERESNPRPSGWKLSTQPMRHHVPTWWRL